MKDLKGLAVSILICVNLFLLTAIVLVTHRPAVAQAQGTGLAGNYLVVSAEIRDEFDALYLLDLRDRLLHGLIFEKGTNRLMYADSRDLEREFRNK